jgi:hypothetical protein
MQETASSTSHSVLVFVHFIKPAFTIGIEESFQILEIGGSRWPHHGLELIIGHGSRSLRGVPRGLVGPRLARFSTWLMVRGLRPADIGAITDPLRKGPENRWAGGWVSRGSRGNSGPHGARLKIADQTRMAGGRHEG